MEKPGSKSTLAWLQRLVFVLIWVSVIYVCLQCFNAEYYFLLWLLFSFEKSCPREDAQMFCSQAGYHMCTFFWHALQMPCELLFQQFGREMTLLSWVPSYFLGRLPWSPSPQHLLSPASFKAWWAMSTEHGILGDAHFLCLLGKPSQIMLVPLHQRSKLRDYEIRMILGKHK